MVCTLSEDIVLITLGHKQCDLLKFAILNLALIREFIF